VTEEQEILQAFLEEGRENLERVELDLVALEAVPDDAERLTGIYRALHTIKGTCGFLGLEHLQDVTHRGEDLLDALRAGEVRFGPGPAGALLALVDDIRARLDALEQTGTDDRSPAPELLAALADAEAAAPAATPAAPSGAADADPATIAALHRVRPESSIRVDAAVLDTLMDLAGELVLVRGRLGALAAGQSGGELVETYRHLRRATGELLESVRQARLQPIGIVIRKFPRVARDLAADLGRQVTVQLSGEEVGVDRAVNEALADALLHLVRNAVDHGIETPQERAAAGKPLSGRIAIAAGQEGGRVRVQITDDGRGIDGERLAARAVSLGLIAREEAAELDDAGRLELIFLPGLSTRTSASAVSGRGVGMDAVRAHLARIGGTVELSGAPGRGTTVRIDVPLTLAIVACVLVRSGAERYCIPQAAVCEVVRLGSGEVDDLGGARLYRSGGELIPLVDLAYTFGAATATAADPDDDTITAVIVESEGRRYGLVVDSVEDPLEAVVKPLPASVRGVRVLSGVTILADGRPTLILDLTALATHVGLTERAEPVVTVPPAPAGPERIELLLARAGDGRRLAVPAARVWRLERALPERLHEGSGYAMLDYGDELLPLVRLDAERPGAELEVIVCTCASGRVGLVVEAIEDVSEAELVVAPSDGRPGLVRDGPDGEVAELLDVDRFASTAVLVA
jgi:two-component system, chemotaxis family, sensor kinase CheA